MLIGDIIMSARELMTDLPSQVVPIQGTGVSGFTYTVIPASAGETPLTPRTYYISVTGLNPWGETTLWTDIATVPVLVPGQVIRVASTQSVGVGGVYTSVRFYIGFTDPNGNAGAYIENFGTFPFNIGLMTSPGFPPNRNTCYLPDSAGRFVSQWTVYRWLNDALTTASLVCGGIPDVSGIQMISGQGFYTMPGIWDKLENCWYDGFPVAFDARSGAFYRNVLSGITFIGILQTSSDRQIMELQPQPSRQGGVTTLSAAIGINDTSIPLTAISQFGLPLGMALIGTEVISYGSISGNALKGCSRGLGGTQQSAWPIGTTITELNFRFGGLRLAQQANYRPGSAFTTLQVPPGWAQPLAYYLSSRFEDAAEDPDKGEKSLKRFVAFLKEYQRGTKQTGGPRQVGMVTSAGDGYPSASSGGRIIIP